MCRELRPPHPAEPGDIKSTELWHVTQKLRDALGGDKLC